MINLLIYVHQQLKGKTFGISLEIVRPAELAILDQMKYLKKFNLF